jgi:hypothetical protein
MAAGGRQNATVAAVSASRACDSCGRTDEDDVIAVHRIYITPESWDTEERIDVVEEIEHWCFVCRSHYPHQVVGQDELEL